MKQQNKIKKSLEELYTLLNDDSNVASRVVEIADILGIKLNNLSTAHYTWEEITNIFTKYNSTSSYCVKGAPTHLTAVAVISQDSFSFDYTEQQRSYKFTSDNKYFLPSASSSSIFAYCLDGVDEGVRLDYYIKGKWKINYCYLVQED